MVMIMYLLGDIHRFQYMDKGKDYLLSIKFNSTKLWRDNK